MLACTVKLEAEWQASLQSVMHTVSIHALAVHLQMQLYVNGTTAFRCTALQDIDGTSVVALCVKTGRSQARGSSKGAVPKHWEFQCEVCHTAETVFLAFECNSADVLDGRQIQRPERYWHTRVAHFGSDTATQRRTKIQCKVVMYWSQPGPPTGPGASCLARRSFARADEERDLIGSAQPFHLLASGDRPSTSHSTSQHTVATHATVACRLACSSLRSLLSHRDVSNSKSLPALPNQIRIQSYRGGKQLDHRHRWQFWKTQIASAQPAAEPVQSERIPVSLS